MKLVKITKKDLTGQGVVFENGKVVISWTGCINSIVIYESIEDLKKMHANVQFQNLSE